MLESELGGVNKTMKSLSNQGKSITLQQLKNCKRKCKPNFAGDENGKREEDLEEEIKDVKERFRNAEVIICSHLGTI